MKARYLVIGLGAVLALSLAVPALGGPPSWRLSGGANLKQLVKSTLRTTTSAKALAATAQDAATAAQSKASDAQAGADAAKGVASAAQSTTDRALGTGDRALGTANEAQSSAAETAGRIAAAEVSARNAVIVLEGKMGHTVQVSAQGVGVGSRPDGSGDFKVAYAQCPSGTFVAGGGFALGKEFSTPNVSEPERNGWVAEANTEGGPLTAWATCLTR